MGSRFDEDFADSAVADLLYTMGQSVTHWPAGISSASASVTAIWTPTAATEVTSEGRKVRQSGSLQVADSVELDSRDIWVIDDVKYTAGEWMSLPGGMQQAMLKTPKQETTQPGRSGSF